MPLKGQDKTVNVKMPKNCHQVVQVLKAQYDIPMGDVMYYPARHEIHKQAVYCRFMQGVLKQHGIPLDPHAKKECYGFWCKNCLHEAACKINRYQGVFETDEEKEVEDSWASQFEINKQSNNSIEENNDEQE